MEPIIIREDLTAPDGTRAPLRIVVYERYSRFINSMHSLVSPHVDHKWYVIAEVGAELPTQEFFGGPMAVFEGVTWTRHTMDDDYQPLVDELMTQVNEYLADRFPADGVRKSRFEWEPLDFTPMPVEFVEGLRDELAGMPEEEFSDPAPNSDTDHEQTIYDNRKETLGTKRAGRYIALQNWREKRKKAAAAAAEVINLDAADGHPLPSMGSRLVNMTFDGPTDPGAHHRAIAIARDLVRLGHWDGHSPIRIADPYAIYNRVDHYVTCRFEDEYGELVVRKADKPKGE